MPAAPCLIILTCGPMPDFHFRRQLQRHTLLCPNIPQNPRPHTKQGPGLASGASLHNSVEPARDLKSGQKIAQSTCVCGMPQPPEGLDFNLADPFPGHTQLPTDFFKRIGLTVDQAIPHLQNAHFSRR